MKTKLALVASALLLAACSAVPLTPEQVAAREAAKSERATADHYEDLRRDMSGPDPLGGAY